MAKIITIPDPRLKKKSEAVTKIDSSVEKLICDLQKTLHKQKDPEGVGISAPQIGVNKRVFIIKTGFSKDENLATLKETIFINPEIIESSKDTNFDHLTPEDRYFEGCLSIPGLYGEVKRPWKIKVRYNSCRDAIFGVSNDVTMPTTVETRYIASLQENIIEGELSGFDSIYFQHEFDHLNGILFTERVKEQGGKLFKLNKDNGFEPL